jgi:glucose-6-phosphate 1-dehydrogenase
VAVVDEKPVIVIFGATGDLAVGKLIPALLQLHKKGVMQDMPLVCVSRRAYTDEDYISFLGFNNKEEKEVPMDFIRRLHYISYHFLEGDPKKFREDLHSVEQRFGCSGNRVYYVAVSSRFFGSITERIAFEKPFGHDLASATELNDSVMKVFTEDEIYRVDHYLGKALVQNILVFRFANAVFEQVWKGEFVDHVQITVSEDVGIEGREEYYDAYGVLRDMVQNHLLQLVSLVAMEQPASMDAESISDEKMRVVKQIKLADTKHLVQGQYVGGVVDGKVVKGYADEKGIGPDSRTATYAAVKMFVDTKRWKEVPFYLRTGKRMRSRYARIDLVLKDARCTLFSGCELFRRYPNAITIRIQPDEGIGVRFFAKDTGFDLGIQPVLMDYCHMCSFGANSPEAYEVVLHDIVNGDHSLFSRWDFVQESWRFTDRLLRLSRDGKKPRPYAAGTDGPKEGFALIESDGRTWCKWEVEQ